jgi:hypothetical protein
MTTTPRNPEHAEFVRRIGLEDIIARLRADPDRARGPSTKTKEASTRDWSSWN